MKVFTLKELTDFIKSGNFSNDYATSDVLEGKFSSNDLLHCIGPEELNCKSFSNIAEPHRKLTTENGIDYYEGADDICLVKGDNILSVYSTMPKPFLKMESRRPDYDEKAITVGEIIATAKKAGLSEDTELAYGAMGIYNPIVEIESGKKELVLKDNTIYKSWRWEPKYTDKIKKIKDLKKFKVDIPVRFVYNKNPISLQAAYVDVYEGTANKVIGLNINKVVDGKFVRENSSFNYMKEFKKEVMARTKARCGEDNIVENSGLGDLLVSVITKPLTTYLTVKELKTLVDSGAARERSIFNSRPSISRNRDGSIAFSKGSNMMNVRHFSKVNGDSKYFKAGQKLANDEPNLETDKIESAAKEAGVPEEEMTNFIFGYNSIDKKAPDIGSGDSKIDAKRESEGVIHMNIKEYSQKNVGYYVKRFSEFDKHTDHIIWDGAQMLVLSLDRRVAVERTAMNLGKLIKGYPIIAYKTTEGETFVAFYDTNGELIGLLDNDIGSDYGTVKTFFTDAAKVAKNKVFKSALIDSAKNNLSVPYISAAMFDSSYEDKWVADVVKIKDNSWLFGDKISSVTVKDLNKTL